MFRSVCFSRSTRLFTGRVVILLNPQFGRLSASSYEKPLNATTRARLMFDNIALSENRKTPSNFAFIFMNKKINDSVRFPALGRKADKCGHNIVVV